MTRPPEGRQTPDFGPAAEDYRRHRRGFPPSLFERLLKHEIGLPGQRILDVGAGTCALSRGFSERDARPVAVDRSQPMLRAGEGATPRRIAAVAEHLPFAPHTFEVVAAGQCWHWFDGRAAAAECARVLVPGGHVAVLHFDYLARPDNAAGLTEKLLLRHDPTWDMAGSTGIYDRWRPDLRVVGFEHIVSFHYDEQVHYTQEDWRGRIRACNAVLRLGDADRIAAFDRELAEALEREYGDAPLVIPHRIFGLLARSPVTS